MTGILASSSLSEILASSDSSIWFWGDIPSLYFLKSSFWNWSKVTPRRKTYSRPFLKGIMFSAEASIFHAEIMLRCRNPRAIYGHTKNFECLHLSMLPLRGTKEKTCPSDVDLRKDLVFISLVGCDYHKINKIISTISLYTISSTFILFIGKITRFVSLTE